MEFHWTVYNLKWQVKWKKIYMCVYETETDRHTGRKRGRQNERIKVNSSGINEQVAAIDTNAFLWAS